MFKPHFRDVKTKVWGGKVLCTRSSLIVWEARFQIQELFSLRKTESVDQSNKDWAQCPHQPVHASWPLLIPSSSTDIKPPTTRSMRAWNPSCLYVTYMPFLWCCEKTRKFRNLGSRLKFPSSWLHGCNFLNLYFLIWKKRITMSSSQECREAQWDNVYESAF